MDNNLVSDLPSVYHARGDEFTAGYDGAASAAQLPGGVLTEVRADG